MRGVQGSTKGQLPGLRWLGQALGCQASWSGVCGVIVHGGFYIADLWDVPSWLCFLYIGLLSRFRREANVV